MFQISYICPVMFKDFKPVFIILVRFLAIYLVLIFVYQQYLLHFQFNIVDPFTGFTAKSVSWFQDVLGYKSGLQNLPIQWHSILFLLDGKPTTRIVEGCNAVSVMVLFVAFVLAFYRGWKTIVYLAVSLVFLFLINCIRIAGLNIIYLDHPDYIKIAHDYAFPAIIYGSVVVLWLIWIKVFALKNENN